MARAVVFVLLLLLVSSANCKKGGKSDEVDVSDVVNPDPDATSTETKEYNKDLVEGDMKAKKGNSEDRNAVSDPNRLWPQGIVPYEFDYTVVPAMRRKIQEAIKDYDKYTCIKIVPRKNERDYIKIKSEKDYGCYAYKGRDGGEQPLQLEHNGCDKKGTIIHELLHTLGFAHEQNRNDRDRYVTVNFHNMFGGSERQFEKLTTAEENTQGYGYDYSSVMHYSANGFSKNGRPTIVAKNSRYQQKIGQRAGFSKQDLKEVNSLYKCRNGRSGVGGVNGCSDKDGTRCADLTGYKNGYHCKEKGVRDYCRKSCKAC